MQCKISDFGCGDRMAKIDEKCPFCERKDLVKKHGYGKSGHQRYRCPHAKKLSPRNVTTLPLDNLQI